MPDCQLRKRFEWCEDVEKGCSLVINEFSMDVEASERYCKLFSLEVVPKLRYLKYVDNLVRLADTPTEILVFLKQCGLSMDEIADLLNTRVTEIKKRFSEVAKVVEDKKELLEKVVAIGAGDTLRSLQSKWAQLSEMRSSPDEEIQLKAIKLQIEVEAMINSERDRMLQIDKLRKFMALMEAKVVKADYNLRDSINRANRHLVDNGCEQLDYTSIVREIRRAIEKDPELLGVRESLTANKVVEVSTERTKGVKLESAS